jgi:NADH-quinone oxidoreductase subunit G
VRNGKILRGNNRDHSGINGEFLCIKGRYGYDFIEHPERLRTPLIRKEGRLVEATWTEAIQLIASRWKEILARPDGASPAAHRFGVIGSNHTTNEENYILQKFTRTVLGTNNLDHHRTADYAALMEAISGQPEPVVSLARSKDLSQAATVLLIGNDPTEQHPLLAWNLREGNRLRGTKLYVINSRKIRLLRKAHGFLPVAEGHISDAIDYLRGEAGAEEKLIGTTAGGREVTRESLADFRSRLLADSEKELVVVFGSEVTGETVSRLVEWGIRLPGQTRFIALGDYSNSRGASDMGLLPDALPGYGSVSDAAARERFELAWHQAPPAEPGLSLAEMLSAVDNRSLEALYVVGANPLKGRAPADFAGKCFLVVQDLFLHETAQAADVVLPAASAYEKSGTVTNTCGELQRLRKGMEVPGTRPDLEIFSLLAAALGVEMQTSKSAWKSDEVLEEIRHVVPGYGVPLVNILAGGAEPVVPLDGYHPFAPGREGNIHSAGDSLFTSGTAGRYSKSLQSVPERHTRKQSAPA